MTDTPGYEDLAAMAEQVDTDRKACKGELLDQASGELITGAYKVRSLMDDLTSSYKSFRAVQTKILPPIMDEMGIPEKFVFDPVNGNPVKIKIGDYLIPSYLKEDREAVNDWFESIGQGGVIKRKVVIELPPGKDDYPDRIRSAVQAVLPGAVVKLDRSVHYQTFKASVTAMHKAGRDISPKITVLTGREAALPRGIFPTKDALSKAIGSGGEGADDDS